MPRRASRIRCWTVVATAALASACASPGGVEDGSTARAQLRATGTVLSIDTSPWTYDGHAVVQVDTREHGRLDVQLPARWNLCQAQAVDVEALKPGMAVGIVGAAETAGVVVVCADPSHRLLPLSPAG